MAEITKELGRIPVSRGNYQATTEYYKDNIVQYKRGSYQVVSESPIIGIPPTNDKNVVNSGWTLFAGTLDAQDVVNQIKEQEEEKIQIGMSFDSFVIERWQRDRDIFVSVAKELGAEVNVQNANGDVEEQKKQIDYFIQKGMDVIVIICIDSDSLQDSVKKAQDAG